MADSATSLLLVFHGCASDLFGGRVRSSRLVAVVRTVRSAVQASSRGQARGRCRPSILDEGCQLVLRCVLGAAGADDAVLVGEHDQLGAVADLELGEQAADVGLDGCVADEQLCGDLSV